MQIAALYPYPAKKAGWVRTGETTAVPSKISADVHLVDPPVVVSLLITVGADGRGRVREFHIEPSQVNDGVTTSMPRKLPIDQLVKATLERATRTDFTPRPDIHPGAYQFSDDPAHQAWVSPPPKAEGGRGRAVSQERIRRVAEIYAKALADQEKAPIEVVVREMGYSRPTAARDIRAAREDGLLPPTDHMIEQAKKEGRSIGISASAAEGKAVWRSLDDPEVFEPIDVWVDHAGVRFAQQALRAAVGATAWLGAADPQSAGEAVMRAVNDITERDFSLRAGIAPMDLQAAAQALYERSVGQELAARREAGQEEGKAFDQIVAEVRAKLDEANQ